MQLLDVETCCPRRAELAERRHAENVQARKVRSMCRLSSPITDPEETSP
ncbi:MAG: hypothetical protein GYA24_23230 [Candidatus Lokiarchaeota archaeon]|nr:hypothetical protein [Candidatus Lokiarchaeota archaeon]